MGRLDVASPPHVMNHNLSCHSITYDAKVHSSRRPSTGPLCAAALLSITVGLAGGAKVLDGLGKALRLDDQALAPSRAVLHDYGGNWLHDTTCSHMNPKPDLTSLDCDALPRPNVF